MTLAFLVGAILVVALLTLFTAIMIGRAVRPWWGRVVVGMLIAVFFTAVDVAAFNFTRSAVDTPPNPPTTLTTYPPFVPPTDPPASPTIHAPPGFGVTSPPVSPTTLFRPTPTTRFPRTATTRPAPVVTTTLVSR